MKDYPKAIKYHTESLTISREFDDKERMQSSLNNLGLVYGYGQPQKALPHYNQSLEIARARKDNQGQIAIFSGNTGEICHTAANDSGFKNTGSLLPASQQDKLTVATTYLKDVVR